MLEYNRAFVLAPKLDSIDALAAELAACGVKASRIPDTDVDVYLRAIYNDPAAVEAALWLQPEMPSRG